MAASSSPAAYTLQSRLPDPDRMQRCAGVSEAALKQLEKTCSFADDA